MIDIKKDINRLVLIVRKLSWHISYKEAGVLYKKLKLLKVKKQNVKRCRDCYWITPTGDGHFLCEDGDLKIRVRKRDVFSCDNFKRKK